MADQPKPFVWYDLMTTDLKAAETFYRAVVGWATEDSGMQPPYTLLVADGIQVGGLMPIPPEAAAAGGRPMWSGYIGVPDVDDYAKRVEAAGGKVHRPPSDIPHVGRFSVVADPFGASFILFKGSTDASPKPVAPNSPGHIGWNELYTDDLDKAWTFYSGLFGWKKGNAVDMGPMGIYQLFNAGAEDIGGMMKRAPDMPGPSWQYYFNVDAADAAVTRITKAGGKVVNGPHEVPGGMWIVMAADPQGAMFSVVASKR